MKFKYNNTEYNFNLIEDDYVSNVLKETENFYEIEQLEYQKSLIENIEGVVYDVGTHIASHAIYYATQCNAEKVYCFEPQFSVFDVACMNIIDNNLEDKIRIKNVALFDHITEKKIYTNHEKNSGSNSLHKFRETCNEIEIVECITLDYFVSKNNLEDEKIKFIKLDTELTEVNVVLGGIHTIEKHRPLIYAECHSNEQYNDILSILKHFDYNPGYRQNEHCYFYVEKN